MSLKVCWVWSTSARQRPVTEKSGTLSQSPDTFYLKRLYPPIHYREIVRIVGNKFGYKTNHGKVKRFLERHPVAVQLELELTHFHDFEDAFEARWTVVRMFYEGWNKKCIAGVLKLSRQHVATLIEAFEKDGFAALEDKRTRPENYPDNQMTLPFLDKVFKAQLEYPDAGRFRLHGMEDFGRNGLASPG